MLYRGRDDFVYSIAVSEGSATPSKPVPEADGVVAPGETARKANARAVTQALSELAGDFVVATAGPALEGVLAGRGSGAGRCGGA